MYDMVDPFSMMLSLTTGFLDCVNEWAVGGRDSHTLIEGDVAGDLLGNLGMCVLREREREREREYRETEKRSREVERERERADKRQGQEDACM
jgi:hypothetical protein